MRRAVASFVRYGYGVERAGVAVYLGHRDNVELLAQTLREYLALASYRLRGYMSDTPAVPALVAAPARTANSNASDPAGSAAASTRREGPIVILGASYAKGWHPGIDGLTFVNEGVEGQQSFEFAGRFDEVVLARNARAVILWGFVNDVFRTPRSDIAQALARVRDSYESMLRRAGAAGVIPILATEATMGRRAGAVEALMTVVGGVLGKQSYADYVNRHVMDTNEWLRETARQRQIQVLDFERAMAGGSGLRRRAFTAADGSHLTPAAYEALSRFATPVLQPLVSIP
jgi:lysophospholipase L1-like esterase